MVTTRHSSGGRLSCAFRDLVPDDSDAIGSIHLLAFSRSTLATLGIEVMRRYYRWLLSSPETVNRIGAYIGGELVGFAIVSNSYRPRSFLKREWALLSIRAAITPQILTRCAFLPRLLGAREPRVIPVCLGMSTPLVQGSYCRLVLIAITPKCRELWDWESTPRRSRKAIQS